MIQVKISNHIAMNLEVLINGGEGNLCIHEWTGMCVCVCVCVRVCVQEKRQYLFDPQTSIECTGDLKRPTPN